MATPYNKMNAKQRKAVHAQNKAWKARNKEKAAQYKQTHYRSNRDKYLRIERERSYVKLYGIGVARYDEMFAAQNGKCAICGSETSGSRSFHFAVDHDHVTGEVRGLLCIKCNWRLGWYEAHTNAVMKYLRGNTNG
jgi:hypothetical protein